MGKTSRLVLLVFLVTYGISIPGVGQGASAVPASVPSSAPVPEPPAIQSLLRPELFKRALNDKEILEHASLTDGHYSFYAAMLVHSDFARTRRILTNYSLYSKLVPYVDKTSYSPITRVLDVEGGIWKWRLHSWVRFEERGDRWIHYVIVGGHFRGLEGDMFFESEGEKGTLVYFRGDQDGKDWPPRLVIERGAEIVFGFTAGRMRKYVESNEDSQGQVQPNGPDRQVPQPRSHL